MCTLTYSQTLTHMHSHTCTLMHTHTHKHTYIFRIGSNIGKSERTESHFHSLCSGSGIRVWVRGQRTIFHQFSCGYWESHSSLHVGTEKLHSTPCGTEDHSQVFRLGGKPFYPLSGLADPTVRSSSDYMSRLRLANTQAYNSIVSNEQTSGSYEARLKKALWKAVLNNMTLYGKWWMTDPYELFNICPWIASQRYTWRHFVDGGIGGPVG